MTTLDDLLAELTAGLPHGPAHRLFRCPPDVFVLITRINAQAPPDPAALNERVGTWVVDGTRALYGQAVITVDAAMPARCYQFTERGQVVKTGKIGCRACALPVLADHVHDDDGNQWTGS